MLLILALAAVALEPPRVFRLDPSALQETMRRVHAQDTALAPALAAARRRDEGDGDRRAP